MTPYKHESFWRLPHKPQKFSSRDAARAFVRELRARKAEKQARREHNRLSRLAAR